MEQVCQVVVPQMLHQQMLPCSPILSTISRCGSWITRPEISSLLIQSLMKMDRSLTNSGTVPTESGVLTLLNLWCKQVVCGSEESRLSN